MQFDDFETQVHPEESHEPTAQDWAEYNEYLESLEGEEDGDEYESDGQPDEYTEWQDVYGGDDWDHGQYDCDW